MDLKKHLVAAVTAFSLFAASGSGTLAQSTLAESKDVEDDGGDAAVVVMVALAALILFGGVVQPTVPAGE